MTIRKYNPKKKMVPYGEETEIEVKRGACGIENRLLCCYCICVNDCVNSGMEEAIHFACDGDTTI